MKSASCWCTSIPVAARPLVLRVQTRDRYGRTVAEVFRGQQNLNVQMVRRGQAFAYRQYLRQCDAAAYLGAERGAEIDRLGVWAERGGITRPWDFRQGRRSGATPAAPAPRPSSSSTPRPSTSPPPEGRRYSCKQIGSYARAQELLQQGHSYLDGNGDGEACEGLRR